ncbi:MAG: endonuclease/exonuclease/phosphatase family protein [Rhodobacter sp.]|nr:endonuclease/exonuclease/phosphatase family protein [Rhodobacter sp.]MCA3513363.1 endonuclease/exonuclease/phosphatase family protein [Rhodobacter sp.]MCA3520748.1 endonuclease/exonuclease/phosphatase family protein [Rhodobacter sp.]MCA3522835.1 endonuclease/exonuclease/phosphatase family protein [Rhodobacter sp.]MCA3526247.1 endonuclease/exonuclease/phosphatase family protein [Rhodobacter sp.]
MHRDLGVASYNIHKGVGADRRRDLMRTAAVISEIGADIVALQEADTRFGNRRGLLDLDHLRADQGLVPVPVEGSGAAHGWHGNLILVRDALIVQTVHKLVLPGLEPRGALMADLVVQGRPLRVIAAHLGLLPTSRAAQTQALLDRLDALDRRPTLLMGDLNEWRHSGPSLARFGRFFTQAPPVRSFPARYPVLPLDRMMAGAEAELHDLSAHDTPLARRASDHLPIKARLRL